MGSCVHRTVPYNLVVMPGKVRYVWRPRKTRHIKNIICIFIKEMEKYTIYISCAVYCIQIFPLVAKLQQFKKGIYHKLQGEKWVMKLKLIIHMKTTLYDDITH